MFQKIKYSKRFLYNFVLLTFAHHSVGYDLARASTALVFPVLKSLVHYQVLEHICSEITWTLNPFIHLQWICICTTTLGCRLFFLYIKVQELVIRYTGFVLVKRGNGVAWSNRKGELVQKCESWFTCVKNVLDFCASGCWTLSNPALHLQRNTKKNKSPNIHMQESCL